MNLTPIEWAGIVLIVSVLILLIVFVSVIKSIGKRTRKFSETMVAFHSESYIDIPERKVITREYKRNKYSKEYSYELEDYIYMISINPDSKPFRELLKLVNNKSAKKKIKDKLLTLEEQFMFIIDYGNGSRSLSFNNINPKQEVEDRIYFQMNNNELLPEEKSNIKKDILNESIIPLNDSEIFASLVKDSKRFVSKGLTLIKISPKYDFIESNKDFLQNTIQLIVFKEKMLTLGVKTYISLDGSLYGVVANDRNKAHNSVNKAWVNKINSLFPKKKLVLEYVDASIDQFNIDTYITQSREARAINEAIIFVNLAFNEVRNYGSYKYKQILDRTKDISEWAEEIGKELKEKKPPVKTAKNEIEERGVKDFYDIFLDFPNDKLDPVVKYSFKHKKLILETLVAVVNKEATKLKESNVSFTIDLNSVHDLSLVLDGVKLKKNVYIVLQEQEKINHLRFMLTNTAKHLKELNVKTVQFIKDENGLMISLYRIFESEYIMLTKGLNDSTILSDNFKLNLNNIMNIKSKETKIINIK